MASRRASDRLIQAGEVLVNGRQVDQPGTLIDPERDCVEVGGRRVQLPTVFCYVLLNKPTGYLVSKADPHHTRTVFDLLVGLPDNMVPVGRLDLDTTGVLLLTGDGELCHRLTHPSYEAAKTYLALVRGVTDGSVLNQLRKGVDLEDGRTSPARVTLLEQRKSSTLLELTLHEGRKRQVKRMCAEVGHRVIGLERTAFAGLKVGGLERGQWRHLTDPEVARLRSSVGLEAVGK